MFTFSALVLPVNLIVPVELAEVWVLACAWHKFNCTMVLQDVVCGAVEVHCIIQRCVSTLTDIIYGVDKIIRTPISVNTIHTTVTTNYILQHDYTVEPAPHAVSPF